jgi:hypothetical protein
LEGEAVRDTILEMIPLAIIGAVLFGAGFVGCQIGRRWYADDEKQRAIEAGVAEWIIDPVTGVRSFRYRTP